MNAILKRDCQKRLAWPVAGVMIGAIIAINPFYAPRIPLSIAIAAWCIAMALVLILSPHPTGTRLVALTAGGLMAVPCFLEGTPLSRGLMMCLMAAPLVAATALVLVPPIPGFRPRLAYLFNWCHTRQVQCCVPHFDRSSLLQLVVATAILAAGIAGVKTATVHGWLPVRWLAGGIMIFAFAEMVTACLPLVSAAIGLTVPPLMQSPYRSTSVGEFWTRRWNVFASEKVFHPFCFAPLARCNAPLALFTVFAVSGFAHTLLAYMALGKWTISLICGSFFLVQPVFIAAERRFGVRRWQRGNARAWTLAVMTITSPLFVEPALQVIEGSWGAPASVLVPTAVVFGFVLILSTLISLASLAICRESLVPQKSEFMDTASRCS